MVNIAVIRSEGDLEVILINESHELLAPSETENKEPSTITGRGLSCWRQ